MNDPETNIGTRVDNLPTHLVIIDDRVHSRWDDFCAGLDIYWTRRPVVEGTPLTMESGPMDIEKATAFVKVLNGALKYTDQYRFSGVTISDLRAYIVAVYYDEKQSIQEYLNEQDTQTAVYLAWYAALSAKILTEYVGALQHKNRVLRDRVALATSQSTAKGGHILAIPTNSTEAAVMYSVGKSWLQVNDPDYLSKQ